MGLRGRRTYHRTSAGSSLTIRGTDGVQRQGLPERQIADEDFAVEILVLEDAEAKAGKSRIAALDEKQRFAWKAVLHRDTAWAMPEENVEVIERAYAAWNEAGVDAFLSVGRRKHSWRSVPGDPVYRDPMHGKDAVRAYLKDWLDTFEASAWSRSS